MIEVTTCISVRPLNHIDCCFNTRPIGNSTKRDGAASREEQEPQEVCDSSQTWVSREGVTDKGPRQPGRGNSAFFCLLLKKILSLIYYRLTHPVRRIRVTIITDEITSQYFLFKYCVCEREI